jgi:hypothetical protein
MHGVRTYGVGHDADGSCCTRTHATVRAQLAQHRHAIQRYCDQLPDQRERHALRTTLDRLGDQRTRHRRRVGNLDHPR